MSLKLIKYLTAIGDIEVEEYEMEFLEEEEGDEFLEEAIICPVPGCLNKGHIFKKYNIYVTHYTGSWRVFFMFTCQKFKVKETEIQDILNECIHSIQSTSYWEIDGKR